MLYIDNLVPITINILQIFLQLNIIIRFFSYKCNYFITFACSIIIGLLYFENTWMMLAVFFVSTFLYYFFVVKMNLQCCVVAIVAHQFLSFTLQNLLDLFYYCFLTSYNQKIMSYVALLFYVIMFFLLKILPINISKEIKSRMIFVLIICLLCIGITSFITSEILSSYIDSRFVKITLAVLMILIELLIVYVIMKMNRYITTIERYEYQQLYSDMMESSLQKLRGFKHDFGNIINSISGYVSLKRYDYLEEYLQKISQEIGTLKTSDILNSNLKDIQILYGIVMSKISIAEFGNINFHLKVTATDFDVNTLNLLDLSRIVGILLDNAIEATLECERKNIYFEVSNYLGKLKIVTKNTYAGNITIDEHIFQDGFTTKEGHSGFGLFEIKKSIAQYQKKGFHVFFSISIQDNLFVAELLV